MSSVAFWMRGFNLSADEETETASFHSLEPVELDGLMFPRYGLVANSWTLVGAEGAASSVVTRVRKVEIVVAELAKFWTAVASAASNRAMACAFVSVMILLFAAICLSLSLVSRINGGVGLQSVV